MTSSAKRGDSSVTTAAIVNGLLSVSALAFLVWLIYFHKTERSTEAAASAVVPAINAGLNATSTALLLAGRFAIHQRRRALHKQLMLAAFVSSIGFLINYIVYHYVHGETLFPGAGAARVFYFCVLISHIALSAMALPMILWTLYLALTARFAAHVRWAKWTWAFWLYVSVTGVLVFVLLHVVHWTKPEAREPSVSAVARTHEQQHCNIDLAQCANQNNNARFAHQEQAALSPRSRSACQPTPTSGTAVESPPVACLFHARESRAWKIRQSLNHIDYRSSLALRHVSVQR